MPTTEADSDDAAPLQFPGLVQSTRNLRSSDAERVTVAAAVIYSVDRQSVLLARRPLHQHQGGCWEFPGGKLEPGESPVDAVARELLEELGIVPLAVRPFETIDHRYPDRAVRLHFIEVTSYRNTPKGREGQALRWYRLRQLDSLRFPAANRPIVQRLLNLGQPGG